MSAPVDPIPCIPTEDIVAALKARCLSGFLVYVQVEGPDARSYKWARFGDVFASLGLVQIALRQLAQEVEAIEDAAAEDSTTEDSV